MGAALPAFAFGSSILSAGKSVMDGMGASAANEHKRNQARRAAEVARVQADQTDAAYRSELDTTLANIDAIRASSGMSISSPTAQALGAAQTEESERQRFAKVRSLKSQAAQSDADASFYGRAASQALLSGFIGGGASLAGSFGKAGFSSLSNSSAHEMAHG